MSRGLVLSLCDRTGVMVQPWLEAGYVCQIVDLKHPEGDHRDGNLIRTGADINDWLPPRCEYAHVFAFPDCSNLAVSGSKWFRQKGLSGLLFGLQLVESCRRICEWSEAPWMLENPVSTIKSYWRDPDHRFNPWEFTSLEPADNYWKKTCLWTGGGFQMPQACPLPKVEAAVRAVVDHCGRQLTFETASRRLPADLWSEISEHYPKDRIHQMAPSPTRKDDRAVTPRGFSKAAFNAAQAVEAA